MGCHAIVIVLALLLLPGVAWGEAYVCGLTATTGKFSRFVPSSDPSRFVAGQSETCSQIQGEQGTADQIDLYQSTPVRYIKVVIDATVGGVVQPLSMLEMDTGEKEQVDNAIAAEMARREAWQSEVQTPGVCKYNDPATVDAKVDQVKLNNQNNINATSFSAADKQQLISLSNRLTEAIRQAVMCDVARAGGG